MDKTKQNEALTILSCISSLVEYSLRECDAVQCDQDLLEATEDLGRTVNKMWEELFIKY